jgi:ABC-type dipeptide/oligopeptide/nickel transport system permease subunit/outer membrane protein assembly factor BamB
MIRKLKRLNYPLALGIFFSAAIIALAIFGPDLAPQNPMKENYSLIANGKMRQPPYPPFSVEGYYLGTDRFGRDLLSRILWGVRPTISMVAIIAAVRLILALIIGMIAGWSKGRLGRWIDSLISAAGSLPVLIVALIAITAVGIEDGIPVFIFGLALTGWAETAHLVAQETRRVSAQTYIEVSEALGASNLRIMLTHVLRQILPLIWMLLAFEMSATLIVVAELGFLGYYIGGGVWIEVQDFQAFNAAGLPELGQLLSTALVNLTQPLPLVVTGSVLFFAVLGFNLLGEGLRRELSPEQTHSQGMYPALEKFADWFDQSIQPLITKRNLIIAAGAGAIISIMIIAQTWKPAQQTPSTSETPGIAIAGDHLWASERRDAQGSRWVPYAGPAAPQLLWQTHDAEKFSGGPVITADGTIIVAGDPKILLAYSPSGSLIWKFDLPVDPYGTPALDHNGNIFIADMEGGLTKLTPRGELIWHYTPKEIKEASAGPIVAQNGSIFYPRAYTLEAVSPEGNALWSRYISSNYMTQPARLSAQESFVFVKNYALSSQGGAPQNTDALLSLSPSHIYTDPDIFIGADKLSYIRVGHGAAGWHSSQEGFVIDDYISWDGQNAQALFPYDAGITPQKIVWLFYRGSYSLAQIIWIDANTKAIIGTNDFRFYNAAILAIDSNDHAFLCAPIPAGNHCVAFNARQAKALWELDTPASDTFTGGAIIPGKMIITTRDGFVFVYGDQTP